MAAMNVDKLSLKELTDLEIRVKKAIMVAKSREQDEFLADVKALAAKRGIAIGEVFGGGKTGGKGGKVAVKYRNRDNPSETWTGRGRQPKWLAAAIKKGAKLQDFAI
jgi:DNA-binding protein H-NS